MNERPRMMGGWFLGPSDIRLGGARQGIFPQALVLRQFGKPTGVSTVIRSTNLCRTSLDFAPTAGCWDREGGYHRIHAQIPSGLCPVVFGWGTAPKTGLWPVPHVGANYPRVMPPSPGCLKQLPPQGVPSRSGAHRVRQGFPSYQGSANGAVTLTRRSLPRWSRNRVGRDARLEPLRVA